MRWPVFAIVMGVGIALATALAWLWTPDKSRPELEAKYLNSNSDIMSVAGHKLHVRDSGSKASPTVILLHGLGSSLHTWELWAQALTPAFRVVRYDLSGSGLSEPDPLSDYGDTRSLDVLLALMDTLKIGKASLIGNSIGGRLAWKFAAKHPERVEKLVLISPDGYESPGFEYGKRPHVPAIMKLMKYVLPKSILRTNLAPAYGDAARLSDETVTRYYDMMLAPGSRGALIARMEQTVLSPPEPFLEGIEAPTLLVWGDKDAMIPIANAAEYQKHIRNAALVTLTGLGHVPHEEAPNTSLPAVQAFLAR